MKSYRVGVAGESQYQPAIRDCRIGQTVKLVHEPDNTHDETAIRVTVDGDETIGYLFRDSWLKRALLYEQKDAFARIDDITDGGGGQKLGVVLEVFLGDQAENARLQAELDDSRPMVTVQRNIFGEALGCLILIGIVGTVVVLLA